MWRHLASQSSVAKTVKHGNLQYRDSLTRFITALRLTMIERLTFMMILFNQQSVEEMRASLKLTLMKSQMI